MMIGLTTLPQSNQEPLVVKEQTGRLPGELGVSKSMDCDTFSLQFSVIPLTLSNTTVYLHQLWTKAKKLQERKNFTLQH